MAPSAQWREAASFRARRDGLAEVRAADVAPGQAFSALSAIASHNHRPVACAVGRRGGSSVLALYRAPEAAAAGGAGGGRRRAAGPGLRLETAGELELLCTPTRVAWCDDTLACGTREGTVVLLRTEASKRGDEMLPRKIARTLKPQWASSQQQAAAGVSSVAVGADDGRHAQRIGAVVGASPFVWDAGGNDVSFGVGLEAGDAYCLDLDWDKGVIVVGDSANALTLYDPRAGGSAIKVQGAHCAPLNTVRCAPLHPHWVASGAADGVVKIWDLRRLDESVMRLAWHVTSVADLSWSWSHADMLASCAYDGSHRFWNLSLGPRFEFFNADDAWGAQELVGCAMTPWPGCPLDCLAASATGLVQLVRPSSTHIVQPLAEQVARRMCEHIPDPQTAGLPPPDTLAPLFLNVTMPATQVYVCVCACVCVRACARGLARACG